MSALFEVKVGVGGLNGDERSLERVVGSGFSVLIHFVEIVATEKFSARFELISRRKVSGTKS